MQVTRALAEFATGLNAGSIPADVKANATLAILDSVGTSFAGLEETPVRIVREFALAEGGHGRSTVFGSGRRASATAAALANGTAAHALDYDSISLTVSGFIASPVIFAVLAVAETLDAPVSGRRVLEAFVAGWEAEAAIARGLGVLHYTKGWHSTATLGHFGAAIGAGRLLGLDTDAMRAAIGIVASEASGLRTMVGHMTNPFHVGKAARNGVTAALLADAGMTAHPDVLEAPNGFCVSFNGPGNYDLDAIHSGLGTQWDLVDPGLVIKIYPCCGLIHSAIDAVRDAMEATGARPEQVRRARVAVHKLVPPTMSYDRPQSGYQAKFSTPFCIATAIREGNVRLAHFSDERVRDPELADLMGRVDMVVHPDLTDDSTFLTEEFSEVTLALADGGERTERVRRIDNRGSRGRPADTAMVRDKLADCLAGYQGRASAEAAFDRLTELESLDEIGPVLALLR